MSLLAAEHTPLNMIRLAAGGKPRVIDDDGLVAAARWLGRDVLPCYLCLAAGLGGPDHDRDRCASQGFQADLTANPLEPYSDEHGELRSFRARVLSMREFRLIRAANASSIWPRSCSSELGYFHQRA